MISLSEFGRVAALDLDPIKVKLMHKESGEGWSLDYANAVEIEYRRFLYLMKKFPNEQTAPLFDVDIFWHYHILDTAKYAQDCEDVFGYFLHHFPYIGLRGEDDEAAHHRVGERMRELYEATFSESYGNHLTGGATNPAAAFSGAVAAVAFSGGASHLTKVAFSGAQARTAFSGAQTKVAFSGAQAKVAFSGAQATVAFSGAQATVAFSGAQARTAFSGVSMQGAGHGFYAERPSLATRA